jgi:uncharacterized membrane protein
MYCFSVSLVGAGPVTIVAARLSANSLYARRFSDVPGVFLAASALAFILVTVLSVILFWLLMGLRLTDVIALTYCSAIVSLTWVSVSLVGSLKRYRHVTLAFSIGLALAVIGATAAALMNLGSDVMVSGFAAGLMVTYLILGALILTAFPATQTGAPGSDFRRVSSGLVCNPALVLGALFAAAANWIDKWIMWTWSGRAETTVTGLVHAPSYDSSMFLAYLAIIPSLSTFVVLIETDFFTKYRAFVHAILARNTLRTVEEYRDELDTITMTSITQGVVFQLSISAVFIVSTPLIVSSFGLQYGQVAIMQLGALAVVFQFVLFAASSVLLYIDRSRAFAAVHLGALLLNGCLTAGLLRYGEAYDGLGFMLSFMASGIAAYLILAATLRNLTYFTMFANNPAL